MDMRKNQSSKYDSRQWPDPANGSVAEIGEEEQKKLLEKYDSEAAVRTLSGTAACIVKWFAIAMAAFHLYTSFFGALVSLRHRAMHLLFVLPLAFMMYPASKKRKSDTPTIIDSLLAVLSIIACSHIVVNYKAIFMRGGIPNRTDIFMGVLTAILILMAVRRVVGIQLVIIAVVFLGYAYFGPYLPGIFAHKGASLSRMVDHIYMIPEGIFSIALGTSSTYIALFVIFATFLEKSGLGLVIKDLGMAIAGGTVGGPAKVAVLASALFGTINGTAAANVVTTGAFTIPLMKSTGYNKEFAGAVEAVASTGGQLMPPIMGSAAFIMADYLGIGYVEIIKAALIPAFLYYFAVFTMAHIRAKKLGLRGLSKDSLPKVSHVLRERGYLIMPFVVVVALLILRYTPIYAGCWGIILTIGSAALKKSSRMGVADILWVLENGAKRVVPVAIACASVGLIIGVCTLTGVSTILGNYILRLSEGNMLLSMFLVTILAIIMGMGLPTTAVYILLVSVAAPAMSGFGLPRLAVHFFVFYFGLLANVTPPVAIPAYAAAGIANSDPGRTGWAAFKLAIPAFIIPYIFIYEPQMLMIEPTLFGVFHVTVTSILGVLMIALAVENYFLGRLNRIQRILLFLGGIALMAAGWTTDIVGLVIVSAIFILQKMQLAKVKAV